MGNRYSQDITNLDSNIIIVHMVSQFHLGRHQRVKE